MPGFIFNPDFRPFRADPCFANGRRVGIVPSKVPEQTGVNKRQKVYRQTVFVFRPMRTIVRLYWITLFNFTAR